MTSHTAIVLADAHVHVHPQTDPAALLDAAAGNFAQAAQRLQALAFQGVLLLAETAGIDWFGSVFPRLGVQSRVGRWTAAASPLEDVSLHFCVPGHELIVVAGRQVVTAERIEVLALGTRARIADGQTLLATLAEAHAAHATIVLPWAVGKWFGRRGKLVSAALRQAASLDLYAGDNAGRPRIWPTPSALKIATINGRPLLSGTDPLPLAGEEQRVGAMGFWLAGSLPAAMPATALRQRLMSPGAQLPQPYGELASPLRCLRSQLALRFRKLVPA